MNTLHARRESLFVDRGNRHSCTGCDGLSELLEDFLRLVSSSLLDGLPRLLSQGDAAVWPDDADGRDGGHLEVLEVFPEKNLKEENFLLYVGISELEVEPVAVLLLKVLHQVLGLLVSRDQDHLELLPCCLHVFVESLRDEGSLCEP